MPALSVVTPSFNGARYIGETLDSVAALETAHEHLVMDGGSGDGTVELLESREDPRLSWVSESDRGQTHAVNKGLERAQGTYIGWLNADDAYIPEAVDRAIEHLEGSPATDAVYGGLEVIGPDGQLLRTYLPAPFNWRSYLFLGDYVPTPTIIFRRSLLSRVPWLDERYRDAADYGFYLRLLHRRRVHRVPEPLVRFRYHAESKTAINQDLQLDEALAIRLSWARGTRDVLVMRAIDRVKRAAYRVVSPLPPKPHVARVVDAARRGKHFVSR